MTSPRTLLVLAGLLVTACVTPKQSDGDGDGGGDDTGGGGDGGGITGGEVTVADLQQGNVAEDSVVTLTGVIVTSPITQDGEGFYIQDAGGGAWSGIYVFLQGTFDGLFLEVGDKLTISGTYTEFYDFSELTITGMDDIDVTGEADVTTVAMDDMTDMEQWEGVLVSLADQTFEACPNTYGETTLASGLKVNDQFFAYESDPGATVTELIGLVEYSFEEFKLNPRSAADLVGFVEGAGCVFTPQEIHDLAASDPDSLDAVELEGVVVTSGLTSSGTAGFFVQAQGGGEKSGLFIYLYDDVDQGSLDLTVGDVVDIKGTASVFYDFTEVSVGSAADIVETGATAAPVADVLTSPPADWNFWEGALVTLVDVEATTELEYGACETDWGVKMDDWIYSFEAVKGTTWGSVTGPMAYSFDEVLILPRGADDLSTR